MSGNPVEKAKPDQSLDDLRRTLNEIAKAEDTEVSLDVASWVVALRRQNHYISNEELVAVCRFDNWRRMELMARVKLG
jgi:hypothetical protein